MSLAPRGSDHDKAAKWIWFDSCTWQSYDDATSQRIESAFLSNAESVQLNSAHRVHFDRTTSPPSFNQLNVITKDVIHVKRTLAFIKTKGKTKTPRDDCNANGAAANHTFETEYIDNDRQTQSQCSLSSMFQPFPPMHPIEPLQGKDITPSHILSKLTRILLYKRLYTAGFAKHSIDRAVQVFNVKFNPSSPILHDLSAITSEVTRLIDATDPAKVAQLAQLDILDLNLGAMPYEPSSASTTSDDDSDDTEGKDTSEDEEDEEQGSLDNHSPRSEHGSNGSKLSSPGARVMAELAEHAHVDSHAHGVYSGTSDDTAEVVAVIPADTEETLEDVAVQSEHEHESPQELQIEPLEHDDEIREAVRDAVPDDVSTSTESDAIEPETEPLKRKSVPDPPKSPPPKRPPPLSRETSPKVDFRVEIGAWIEVNVNANWIPGRIVDVKWTTENSQITISYQDVFNRRERQVILSGADLNRDRCRPMGSSRTTSKPAPPPPPPPPRGRFSLDGPPPRGLSRARTDPSPPRPRSADARFYSSTRGALRGRGGLRGGRGRGRGAGPGGRFNRHNLSVHKFNFSYHSARGGNKKYDEKNAKHPSEYINRKCFKCKGSGKCFHSVTAPPMHSTAPATPACIRCKSTGLLSHACGKCIASSGVYRRAHSLMHSKCAGQGCARCGDTGKYPIRDIMCNNCKGTGVYHTKCPACEGRRQHFEGPPPRPGLLPTRDVLPSGHGGGQRYNSCISGYRLPQLIAFVPKRSKLAVHGSAGGGDLEGMQNMKRLYHATDRTGAEGIIETGTMARRRDRGRGIRFCERASEVEGRARQRGFLVIADVFTGRVREEYYVERAREMGFEELHAMGYDCVRVVESREFVVYHWDQVWCHVVLPWEKVNFGSLR